MIGRTRGWRTAGAARVQSWDRLVVRGLVGGMKGGRGNEVSVNRSPGQINDMTAFVLEN